MSAKRKWWIEWKRMRLERGRRPGCVILCQLTWYVGEDLGGWLPFEGYMGVGDLSS